MNYDPGWVWSFLTVGTVYGRTEADEFLGCDPAEFGTQGPSSYRNRGPEAS